MRLDANQADLRRAAEHAAASRTGSRWCCAWASHSNGIGWREALAIADLAEPRYKDIALGFALPAVIYLTLAVAALPAAGFVRAFLEVLKSRDDPYPAALRAPAAVDGTGAPAAAEPPAQQGDTS